VWCIEKSKKILVGIQVIVIAHGLFVINQGI
jgi:hypothetical protein